MTVPKKVTVTFFLHQMEFVKRVRRHRTEDTRGSVKIQREEAVIGRVGKGKKF